MKAERGAGSTTEKQHPKASPDFNAIEGWWAVLQQRLSLTSPVGLESRGAFLNRLRRTVSWPSKNAREHGKTMHEPEGARIGCQEAEGSSL